MVLPKLPYKNGCSLVLYLSRQLRQPTAFMISSRISFTLQLMLLSLLSAFLLFQVQPVIGNFILPWFGGSPGVWTTCMLFFQIVLFAGYAYAHVLTKLPLKAQWLTHGLLLISALALLPIVPSLSWKPTGGDEPVGKILLLLIANVGLPYFVLASTSPLVQVWFTRSHEGGGNPWRLYALSNAGSLIALLSYPFFFEPRLNVMQQAQSWSVAFASFAALSLFMSYRVWKTVPQIELPISAMGTSPRWWQRALWLFLPALASALVLAATNHVTQDVAVIPFLWVVPLSLYLITFIICFEHPRWYKPMLWASVAIPVLVIAATHRRIPDEWLNNSEFFTWLARLIYADDSAADALINNYKSQLSICFGAIFLGCMVCHGELTRLKPGPERLTEFYLFISAGGALGGVFVNLVAPRLFTTYQEWPWSLLLCLLVALVALGRVGWGIQRSEKCKRLAKCYWVGMIALLSLPIIFAGVGIHYHRRAEPGLPLLASVKKVGGDFLMFWSFRNTDRVFRLRNFYGCISIEDFPDEEVGANFRQLYHGNIAHGTQWMHPHWRLKPLSYYGIQSGIGQALEYVKNRQDLHVGVVGMGTGTVAAYGAAGDRFRFYEIDPDIVNISRTHFTYVSDLEARQGEVKVVLGDARLSLERELAHGQNQQFDVLLLDAFSGDSVPVHLLTREAFEIYKRHMKPNGIIAVHASNTYLVLAPMIEHTAQAVGYRTSILSSPSNDPLEATDYVLVSNETAFLEALPPFPARFDHPKYRRIKMWTDLKHNLLEILD